MSLQILEKGLELARPSGYESGDVSRPKTFSILLKHSKPGPEDTSESCASSLKALKINPERLLELAVLAPAWSSAVELALGWEGLEDASWWLHAHTKDTSFRPEAEKAVWASAISERTPLSAAQLENGACDPAWFHRFRSKLTDKQWKQLDKVAKFASDGTGHARARALCKGLAKPTDGARDRR